MARGKDYILKAIRDQEKQIANDIAAWEELRRLAAMDLAAFHRGYAKYLQANQAYSPTRQLLIDVCERTATALTQGATNGEA